jgi:hypothetical protein
VKENAKLLFAVQQLTEVNPGMRITHLNDLDARQVLVIFILQENEELMRLYNLVFDGLSEPELLIN